VYGFIGACETGKLPIIEFLINHGIRESLVKCFNARVVTFAASVETTGLNQAIKNGHLHIVEFLLSRDGLSLLYIGMTLACMYSNLSIVKFLTLKGVRDCGRAFIHNQEIADYVLFNGLKGTDGVEEHLMGTWNRWWIGKKLNKDAATVICSFLYLNS